MFKELSIDPLVDQATDKSSDKGELTPSDSVDEPLEVDKNYQ